MTGSPLPADFAALQGEIARLLDVPAADLGVDDSLLDWGLDSIRMITFLERLRAGGLEVTFIDFAEAPTLRFLAGRLGLGTGSD